MVILIHWFFATSLQPQFIQSSTHTKGGVYYCQIWRFRRAGGEPYGATTKPRYVSHVWPYNVYFLHFSCILLFVSFEEDVVKSSATEPSPGPEHAGKEESSTWEEQLCAQQEQLEKEMQETRKMVSRLQVSYSYTFIWVFLQHQAFNVKLCKIIIILKNNNTFQIFGINSDNKDMLTKDFYIKDYWKKMVPQNH